MAEIYGNGKTTTSVGANFQTFEYKRKAIIDAKKAQFFSPLGDVETLTKHFGQTMKKWHYIPLLDDRNINDQGIDASGTVISDGNLYGSSKDPATILAKLPTLSETGGRVNRVGFKRVEVSAAIANYGFFYEWSEDSLQFDNDKDLYMHINTESVRGAMEITEDITQMDLLNGAGVIRYTGDATSLTSTGYNATDALNSVVTYDDLVQLTIAMDDNRCPKDSRALVGSRDIDIINIPSARYLFTSSKMQPTLLKMVDYHGNKAFVPIEKYANQGKDTKYPYNNINTLNGEIGAIAGWRIVIVPEMMEYVGGGEDVPASPTTDMLSYLNDGSKYNVYPLLAVGSGSFANIKFQSTGKTNDKFRIIVRKPGTYANPADPFEKVGYSSIQFWQGTMIYRAEWIGKILSLASA